MKWPVSGAAMQAVIDLLAAERQRSEDTRRAARESVQEANARYDALLDKYHALRLSGATAPPPPAPPRERDPLAEAIIAKSRGSAVLYQHYQTLVAEQRARHIPDEAITAEILRGIPDELGAIAE